MQKSNWTKYKLGNFCLIKTKTITPLPNQRYYLYSLPGFDNHKTPEFVYGKDIKSNKFLVEGNGILYNKLNIQFKRIWKVPQTSEWPMICSTEFLPIYPTNDIDFNFFYYILTSEAFSNSMRSCSTGTSNSHQRIKLENILNYELFLPSLHEQKKIADILGAFDDKIELLQKQNTTLENMDKALFKSWFVDFDVVHAKQQGQPKAAIMQQYHLTEEQYNLFPSRFEPSALGPIPTSWQVKTLGQVSLCFDSKRVPLSNRDRASRRGVYPYFGATSVMDYINDFLFDDIYLLLGEDGSVIKNDGTPFLQYVFGKIWVNNHAHVLQGKEPITTEFLYLFLSDFQIQPYVTGAVQAKLNQKNMNSIPMVIPDKNILNYFNIYAKRLFNKIIHNHKQIQTLTEMRDALLPRLISGKIRV